ncbi:hypothetical protein [Lelliottia amnigena]|uniref:hypothetical protein n=1 Tax=Lelliottia amnigena TaxID=61646 RepID=UPI001ED8FA34|nr:hypothetical protein [Lelliottia amnigena]
MTITREWLQKQIAEFESCAERTDGYRLDEGGKNTLDALRIALASPEAEPVTLYRERNPYNGMATGWQELTQQEYEFVKDNASDNAEFRTVYTAPPAPVVPDEIDARMKAAGMLSAADILAGQPMDSFMKHSGVVDAESLLKWAEMRRAEFLRMQAGYELGDKEKDDLYEWVISHVAVFSELHVNIRAAMQGKAEPVTTACKLPVNTPCKEAPEHIWLQTAGIWPENGEFGELTWCSDNQHHDDTLYLRADVVSGNSPVIPDSWVMVPVNLTEQMSQAAYEAAGCPSDWYGFDGLWNAAITAAPQHEEPNRIQGERVKIQEEMTMGARLTKHRFKVK